MNFKSRLRKTFQAATKAKLLNSELNLTFLLQTFCNTTEHRNTDLFLYMCLEGKRLSCT